MEQYKKDLNSIENFKLWESYELLDKYKNIITTFIDNDILITAPEEFKRIYNIYKEYCLNFYKNICNLLLEDYKKVNISWDINFKEKTVILTIHDTSEKFDENIFALNNLQLKDSFKNQINYILK